MVGDIVKPKRYTMTREDVPDRDAKGRPRKLDKGEHESLYDRTEEKSQAPMIVLMAADAQEGHMCQASKII